jgi:hypothetical protein
MCRFLDLDTVCRHKTTNYYDHFQFNFVHNPSRKYIFSKTEVMFGRLSPSMALLEG